MLRTLVYCGFRSVLKFPVGKLFGKAPISSQRTEALQGTAPAQLTVQGTWLCSPWTAMAQARENH